MKSPLNFLAATNSAHHKQRRNYANIESENYFKEIIYPTEQQFWELYNINDFQQLFYINILTKPFCKLHKRTMQILKMGEKEKKRYWKGAEHSIIEYDLSAGWSAMGFDTNDKNLYSTCLWHPHVLLTVLSTEKPRFLLLSRKLY